jgi:hypothetical protein
MLARHGLGGFSVYCVGEPQQQIGGVRERCDFFVLGTNRPPAVAPSADRDGFKNCAFPFKEGFDLFGIWLGMECEDWH